MQKSNDLINKKVLWRVPLVDALEKSKLKFNSWAIIQLHFWRVHNCCCSFYFAVRFRFEMLKYRRFAGLPLCALKFKLPGKTLLGRYVLTSSSSPVLLLDGIYTMVCTYFFSCNYFTYCILWCIKCICVFKHQRESTSEGNKRICVWITTHFLCERMTHGEFMRKGAETKGAHGDLWHENQRANGSQSKCASRRIIFLLIECERRKCV